MATVNYNHRIFLNYFPLACKITSSGFPQDVDMHDVTTLCTSTLSREYVSGLIDRKFTCSGFWGFGSGATYSDAEIENAFSDIFQHGSTTPVKLTIASGGLSVGDPVKSLDVYNGVYGVSGNPGDPIAFSADFQAASTSGDGLYSEGVVLYSGDGATATGTTYDAGATKSLKFARLISAYGQATEFELQKSADGSSWTTVVTTSPDGEVLEESGTHSARYWRVNTVAVGLGIAFAAIFFE